MTDPFFTTGNTAGSSESNNTNQNNPQPTNNQVGSQVSSTSAPVTKPANQIQILTNQQQQIQAKYQELKALYSGEGSQKLNIEQKQQVEVQLKKLSDLYTQNKQTLAMLSTNIAGEKQIQINKNVIVKQQKKNKKISFKGIMLGCALLLIFVVGGLSAVFYYLIQNPNQLSSVGINPQTATQLLQTFTTIFFGLLFFASLGMLITNFYRLTTAKNKSKIGYILGIIFGFIILVGTLVGGAKVLNILKNIQVDDFVDSNSILSIYWESVSGNTAGKTTNPKTEYQPRDSTRYPLIAPANIAYKINKTIFSKKIIPQLGNVNVKKASLDCGNGQELSIGEGYASVGACMYTKKGAYPLKLILTYVNNDTAEQMTKDIDAGTLDVSSQIEISTNQGSVDFSKNEIIVGSNPIKVTYDASDIFTDFQLADYNIVWDANGDGIADKSGLASYTHLYTGAGKQYVKVKYPDLNNHLYVFPIRVEQSDVPVADINYTAISETQYSISAKFFGVNPDISEYIFTILDKQSNKKIDTISSQSPSINYTFPGNGLYAVQMSFVTQGGKQGTAESENISIGGSEFQILYDVSIKTPTDPQFKKLDNTNGGNGSDIILTEIPTILKLDITKIIPASPTLNTQVLVDGSPIVSTDNSFQTTIDTSKDYNITIIVTDPNRDTKTKQNIKVSVKRDDIVGNLLVTPDTVGISPFEVKFDASTTTINDSDDEIVYFTWDFGDGKENIKENLSQSIISHTYTYDFDNENGTFYPKVTIKTKKGRELVVGSGTMILVQKPNTVLKIEMVSHPAQIANVGDKVDMSLDIDGLPEDVIRDFGNGNTLECGNRSCLDASQIYNKPGDYTIGAKVKYPNKPTIEGQINLVVK